MRGIEYALLLVRLSERNRTHKVPIGSIVKRPSLKSWPVRISRELINLAQFQPRGKPNHFVLQGISPTSCRSVLSSTSTPVNSGSAGLGFGTFYVKPSRHPYEIGQSGTDFTWKTVQPRPRDMGSDIDRALSFEMPETIMAKSTQEQKRADWTTTRNIAGFQEGIAQR